MHPARILFALAVLTGCHEQDDVAAPDAGLEAGASAAIADAASNDASSSSTPSASDVTRALDALERDVNPRVEATCKKLTDAAEEEACSLEFLIDIEPCERTVYPTRPAQALTLLACFRRDELALLDCCDARGGCSEDAIDTCTVQLWGDAGGGACDADWAVFDPALDACEAKAGS